MDEVAGRAVLVKLFSKKISNAVRFAKQVDVLLMLLMVNRAYATLCERAPSIIEEYHTITNAVTS